MDINNIPTTIDSLMNQTMSKITKAAASQNLAELEMLTKRERHLQTMMDEQGNIARKFANSNQSGMCNVFEL